MTDQAAPLANLDLRANAVDAVAKQLRKELLSGAIQPGSRILPNEVAKRFSLSHIPVREALRQLESEQLIVRTPHGATHAAEIGLEDLGGLYELRRLIEGEFAARSVAGRDDEHVRSVEQALLRLERASPYSDEFFVEHRAFHWALLSPAADAVTRRMLETLWLGVDRYLSYAASSLGLAGNDNHLDAMEGEHRELQRAYGEGDADALRTLVVEHLTNTEGRIRVIYRDLLEHEID